VHHRRNAGGSEAGEELPDVGDEDLGRLVRGVVRYVALFIDALAASEAPGLPGPEPRPGELNWRWRSGPAAQPAP